MTQPDAAPVTVQRPQPRRQVWVVLARRKYEEPLCQIGTVTAEHEQMAMIYAQSIYDEHPWIEMVVFPRASMRTVIAA